MYRKSDHNNKKQLLEAIRPMWLANRKQDSRTLLDKGSIYRRINQLFLYEKKLE